MERHYARKMSIRGLFVAGMIAASSAVGCAQATRIAAPASTPTERAENRAARSAPHQNLADWTVTLAPDARSGTLRVELKLARAGIERWHLAPAAKGAVSALQARDAGGPIAITLDDDGSSGTIVLAPGARPPVTFSYVLAAVRGGICPFQITADEAVFCGADALAMPVGREAERATMRLRLVPDGEFHRQAASSFGLEHEVSSTSSFTDLSHAGFVFGSLGHARFAAQEGRDHAAWQGYFSFDPRWVAAEAAGVRTGVDRWLRVSRPGDDPSVGLLFAARAPGAEGRGLDIRPLFRGALVSGDASSMWTSRERLDLTRLFAQRTIAASIKLESADEPGSTSSWFDEGIAHAVALDVLRGMGVISRAEAVAEVSSWLAEEALSPYRGRSLAELSVAARSTDPAARQASHRALAIRGALLGLALNDASGDGLQRLLNGLLASSKKAGTKTVSSRTLFEASPHAASGRPAQLRAALESGEEMPLRASDFGPCVTLVRRKVHAYELGFTRSARASDGTWSVATVAPGTAAAKSGLLVGDVITELSHRPGHADAPVMLSLRRSSEKLAIEYLPRGAAREGRALAMSPRRGLCSVD